MSTKLLREPCKECFKSLPKRELRKNIEDEAKELSDRYSWVGADTVLRNIRAATTCGQAFDHLAILRVAKILTTTAPSSAKPVLEKFCRECNRPHDINWILASDSKVIIEVVRLRKSTRQGDRLEDPYTESVCRHGRFRPSRMMLTLEDNVLNLGMKMVFERIRNKTQQLHSNWLNIIWFVSRNFLTRGSQMKDAVVGLLTGDCDLPNDLVGVGWSFDGPAGSHNFAPFCILLSSQPLLARYLKTLGVFVKSYHPRHGPRPMSHVPTLDAVI